jgi:3-phenylpropionate/trans-cinnamate dioxygenase ferredoxin subunit
VFASVRRCLPPGFGRDPLTWIRVCPLAELAADVPRAVLAEDVAICLVLASGEVFAVRDECTHEAVPLSEGEVEDGTIECWLHGSRFDLRTGDALNLPATRAVDTFPVRLVEGEVEVGIAEMPSLGR